MAPDIEKKAKEAFVDDNFELAVDLYTQAIEIEPNNADLFADRAQANIKLGSYTEAVADANRAIELDSSMAKAYLRKATACMKLEEYQTAKAALEAGASLAPSELRFTSLINECNVRIAEEMGDVPMQSTESAPPSAVTPFGSHLSDGTVEDSSLSQKSQPTLVTPAKPKYRREKKLLFKSRDLIPGDHSVFIRPLASRNGISCGSTNKFSEITINLVYCELVESFSKSEDLLWNMQLPRHEYYQKPEVVVVTIFAKGIPSKNVTVDFGEQILSVSIDVPGEDSYHFQPRLFGKIIPEKCRYDVLSTKIEIRLAKAEAINWTSLEFTRENTITQKIYVPSVGGTETGRPTYPSSRSKAVDWDKLEAQVKKEEKEEKLEGDAALNKLFRDIYQDADEDTRRAMRKSFVESHGTVLSTNWKEVGAKKVEGSPPEGMELKKWEY